MIHVKPLAITAVGIQKQVSCHQDVGSRSRLSDSQDKSRRRNNGNPVRAAAKTRLNQDVVLVGAR